VARKVLVQAADGSVSVLTERQAPDERHLQEVVKENPSLLPVDDLGISGPLLVVGRETVLPSGSIDLVGVVPSGDIVLIEFKTGPQNPDFRHALAQLIDYASDLWGTSVADFDEGVVQRYASSRWCPPEFRAAPNLRDMAGQAWQGVDVDWDQFHQRLSDVLSNGDFHLVVAAQRFTPQMIKSLEYLNGVARWGTYHLVQVVHLEGDGTSAYSAQSVASPTRSRRAASEQSTSETEFLAALAEGPYRDALVDIFSTCRTLGLLFGWGSRGTSIRLATPDRSEPLSIGWAFPEGRNWYGLRHFSLGFDTASAQQTPSVLAALAKYVDRLQRIPHGAPVTGKSLRAFTWGPDHLAHVTAELIGALESLVAEAGGEQPGSVS
jgi:hypothetical protein